MDLSTTTVVVPSEGTKHIGGCCHVTRLEDVYAELGLYEAHIEGMWSSNPVLIGWCNGYGFFVESFIHVGLFVAMQVGM